MERRGMCVWGGEAQEKCDAWEGNHVSRETGLVNGRGDGDGMYRVCNRHRKTHLPVASAC